MNRWTGFHPRLARVLQTHVSGCDGGRKALTPVLNRDEPIKSGSGGQSGKGYRRPPSHTAARVFATTSGLAGALA